LERNFRKKIFPQRGKGFPQIPVIFILVMKNFTLRRRVRREKIFLASRNGIKNILCGSRKTLWLSVAKKNSHSGGFENSETTAQ
jgi:hypothetical protein